MLHWKVENMYLVGLAPGLQSPSRHQINHILKPLVDELKQFWKPGIFIAITTLFPEGHLVQAALGPVKSDMLPAHQIAGFAPHSSHNFCSFCQLQAKDTEDFDSSKWPRWSWAEHLRIVREWKATASEADQKRIYTKHGIWWSQLLDLEYWDPMQFLILDLMHALLLRAMHNHCRTVWDYDGSFIEEVPITPLPVQHRTWLRRRASAIGEEFE
ncbi:hypothetical protein K439DRAFT_1646387 [Ramaria rubella]|nr:hypothetical protein K439DRAFT_1646387 [Ramaria rubella]